MDVDDYGPLLTAEAFLEIDFGERIKAELDEGVIVPLVRGPVWRVHVATNLLVLVAGPLRGTGFQAYGSMLMVKTGLRSVRFPDVAVYAQGTGPIASTVDRHLMADPIFVAHVRSMDSASSGRLVSEYQAFPSVQAVMLIDPWAKEVRLVQRTTSGAWLDEGIGAGGEASVDALGLTLPHAHIFARD